MAIMQKHVFTSQTMGDKDFSNIKKLLIEVQKPFREALYDLKNVQYKKNKLKQGIWKEIADEMGMESKDVQALWKRTKMKYRSAVDKANAPSGSARKALRPLENFLLTEMSFIQKNVDEESGRISNYSSSFDEMFEIVDDDVEDMSMSCSDSQAPLPKKIKKTDEVNSVVKNSFEKIEQLVTQLNKKRSSGDSFYNYIEQEIEKFEVSEKEQIKSDILQMILNKKKKN